jgi:hypothetical protein
MDEYLTAVREIERRIIRSEQDNAPVTAPGGYTKPVGIPKDYDEHIRLLTDLLVLAFQADLTRIATFVYANDGSNRSYRFIDVPEGHHDLSHHGGDKEKQSKIKKINTFHMAQFAYFLEKMKASRDAHGSLLDSAMIVYGSGIGDGNRHNHDDLPILLCGKGMSTLKAGFHRKYPKETPLTNLYLTMLEQMGCPVEKLGDSTGKLALLS